MPSEDELAETIAVAPASAVAERTATAEGAAAPRAPVAVTALGRFQLEAELGSGGMGVVHAAFDPELERRVAVKVLHARDADARARLLREARAMARLSHPNVITVFEVGSADGNDFVAMELVEGETLRDWWTRAQPRWRELVTAFVAAGRGLAAAHAAGLVHRDFKPSNVLRSRTGKIVVTDFGLSRAAGADERDPVASEPGEWSATTPLRTRTGAVLGTPAYMAPEQWTGDSVGTASDQFAFCVALWEALAGKRPHSGDSLDDLRRAALAGPDPGAADALPRPVRAIVRRGLARDPAARWPSMDALLDALERALARRRRALGLGAALLVGGAGTVALLATGRVHAVDCAAPAIDPDKTWTPERVATLRGRSAGAADLLEGDIASWRSARARACKADAGIRTPQLACLDGVMARFEVAAQLVERSGAPHGLEGTASLLVDPTLCERNPVPHLTAVVDGDLARGLALFRDARDGGHAADTAQLPPTAAACARALGIRARVMNSDDSLLDMAGVSERSARFRETQELVKRCDDVALQAVLRLELANGSPLELEPAQQAVQAFPQHDLQAEVDILRGHAARRAQRWNDAIAVYERASAELGQRQRARGQLRAQLGILDVLFTRGTPTDIAKAREIVATWRPIARGLGPTDVPTLDLADARARWRLGDVAAADAIAIALGHVPANHVQLVQEPPVDVLGRVVDEAGAPVVGAEVVAAPNIRSDSAHAAAPIDLYLDVRTTTDKDGRFSLSGARGVVVGSAGALRSDLVEVARHVTLVVHRTYRLSGRVTLGTHAPTQLRVLADTGPRELDYGGMAPVRPDGTFVLEGVPAGKLGLVAAPYDTAPPDRERITVAGNLDGIVLVARDVRPLHVIARNTGVVSPDVAIVFVLQGHAPEPHATLASLHRDVLAELEANIIPHDSAPAILQDRMQPDDLFVTMPSRPPGTLFVCTVGVTRDLLAHVKNQHEMMLAIQQSELGCADVSATDDIVVVEIPPLRKPG